MIMWSTIISGNSRKFVVVSRLIWHRFCVILSQHLKEHLVFEWVETSFATIGHCGTLTSLPIPRGTRPERASCTGARVPGVIAALEPRVWKSFVGGVKLHGKYFLLFVSEPAAYLADPMGAPTMRAPDSPPRSWPKSKPPVVGSVSMMLISHPVH